MTLQQYEQIVRLIAGDKNTYADIKSALPSIKDSELSFIAASQYVMPSPNYFRLKNPNDFRSRGGRFLPDDKFFLTEDGQDFLYRLHKEDRLFALTEKSVDIAKESLRVSKHSDNSSSTSALYAKLAFLLGLPPSSTACYRFNRIHKLHRVKHAFRTVIPMAALIVSSASSVKSAVVFHLESILMSRHHLRIFSTSSHLLHSSFLL